MAAVSDKTFSITENVSRPFHEVSKGYTAFKRNDVLVAKITPCFENGKLAIADELPTEVGVGSTEFHVFRPDDQKLDGRYLYYLLRAPYVKIAGAMKMKGAVGQRRVPSEFFSRLKIPLPPLAEQKRIAAILDAADKLRAKRREAIVQLDTLLQSTFLDMFGDPVTNPIHPNKKIFDVVDKFIDYRGKSPNKSEYGVPLITAKIVKEMTVREPNEFIPEEDYDVWMRRGIPSPRDVIITTEAPMGEVGLVPDYKAAYAQRLLVLSPNQKLLESEYFMWALTMPFVTRQMQQLSTGSTVTGIRSKEFKKVQIPVPPINLQKSFRSTVALMNKIKDSQEEYLCDLDVLFSSLQQNAFNGTL